MLKAHEDLLAQIELAEEEARSLHAKGARVDETVRQLHVAAKGIKERIAHYRRDVKGAPKAPAPIPATE